MIHSWKIIKVDTPFITESTREKEIMNALRLTGNALEESVMEHNGKFRHTIGRIQHIALMIIIGICYTACHLATQIVSPTLPGLQGIKLCIQYLDSHPHKPIFYPSNSYDVSNLIKLTWSRNKFEDHTTHNYLEFHQDADHARIINIRRSVSGIIYTLLGFAACWKVQIQPDIAFDSTYGEIRYMYKAVNKTKDIWICMEDLVLHIGAPIVHW